MSFLPKIKHLNVICGTAASAFATVVAFSLPTTVLAQEGSAGALLEEIVTVARKKSNAESVQDVPIAVTAFGAAQLDAQFVRKIEDLSYVMPNVQLESVGTFPGVQNFSIRGQGINSSIPSVDPTVGVFVDGLYMGTTYGVVIDTFDLESVEVLRGPQGLLFGRNVTGGAVVLRNARPDGEFGARVRLGATNSRSKAPWSTMSWPPNWLSCMTMIPVTTTTSTRRSLRRLLPIRCSRSMYNRPTVRTSAHSKPR